MQSHAGMSFMLDLMYRASNFTFPPYIYQFVNVPFILFLQLKKVNSVTLKAWLKERGIQVKSNAKKEELISKVEGYFKAHQPEE